jgi:hypothetical protein
MRKYVDMETGKKVDMKTSKHVDMKIRNLFPCLPVYLYTCLHSPEVPYD